MYFNYYSIIFAEKKADESCVNINSNRRPPPDGPGEGSCTQDVSQNSFDDQLTEQQLLDMLSDNEVKYVLNIKCIRVRYYECVLNGYG